MSTNSDGKIFAGTGGNGTNFIPLQLSITQKMYKLQHTLYNNHAIQH